MPQKISLWFAALLLALIWVPSASYAVMTGPSNYVSPDWRPGSPNNFTPAARPDISNQVAQANGSGNSASGNSANSAPLALPNSGGLKASLDLTVTVTGIDQGANKIALNGKWVDLNRVTNWLNTRYPAFSAWTARAPFVLAILRPGDEIRLKASVSNNLLKIQTVDFNRAGTSAPEVMMRGLIRQIAKAISGMSFRISAMP